MTFDNTHRIAEVNTPSIAVARYSSRMAKDTPTKEDRERGLRLKEAREALYETAEKAAGALKVKPSTYRSHENGYRAPWASLKKYAIHYGYSVEWIAYGTGPKKPSGPDHAAELIGSLRGDFLGLAIDHMRLLKKQQDMTDE